MYGADEASSAAHDESAVPFLRQQQLKSDMLANDALHLDVSGSIRFILRVRTDPRDRFKDYFGQAQLPKFLDADAVRRFRRSGSC